MDLCDVENIGSDDSPVNELNENLIEKYATFLDSEKYLKAVDSNRVGNMFEFWEIILDGIIKKIKFLRTINARELKEGANEEIESELAAITLLIIHNTSLSDEQIESLKSSIELQTVASQLMGFTEKKGGKKKSRKSKKIRKSKKKKKSKKSKKTRKSRKTRRKKNRTNKKQTERIKTGGVGVGTSNLPARTVWNLIDYERFKKNIVNGIQRLKALLGMDDKQIQELEGENIDKENIERRNTAAKAAWDSSNRFIREYKPPNGKLIQEEIIREIRETDEDIRLLQEDKRIAEQAASEQAASEQAASEQAASEQAAENIHNNRGYFILGSRLGSGGSFKTPFQLIYCHRSSMATPFIKNFVRQRIFFNVNTISTPSKLFKIDFEDIIKDNTVEVLWNESGEKDKVRANPKESIYLIKTYLFLKIDTFHCTRKDICDEYELGKKLFDFQYPDAPHISLSPRPLEVYYKTPEGEIVLDSRIDKQEYGIRVGEYMYTVCKTCNTKQTSDNRGMSARVPPEHFIKIAYAFYILVYNTGYLTTDIKPDNMCMTENNTYAQIIDFDEVQFFDKRWSCLSNQGPNGIDTSNDEHKKAALCYMILQYVSTYYIHNLSFMQLYKTGTHQSRVFISNLRDTMNIVSSKHTPNLDLISFFKQDNGMNFRACIGNIDYIIEKDKINDGCKPDGSEHIKISRRERRGCGAMFSHYHRNIIGDMFSISLTPAMEFVCDNI